MEHESNRTPIKMTRKPRTYINSIICPYIYKYELLKWAYERYPLESKKKFKDMGVKQLKAIYHNSFRGDSGK